MSLVLVTSDRFADHLNPPGHPERVERAEVMQVVAARWQERGGSVVAPQAATRDELLRVHASGYLDRIAATASRAVQLDPDTYTSPESHDVALLAAGAVVQAVDTIWPGPTDDPDAAARGATRAYALVRPPGHHAERDRAMGFCLYNNVAIAAAHALALGARRVAIVDYDVHHGNGTQWIFYEEPRVLYVSTHQYPYYPGTGAAEEAGRGRGEGFTLNVPLEAGATDADYDLVFSSLVVPILRQFAPDLLVVSAGFDAHERDPLGGMRMTTAGYARLTGYLKRVAVECCRGLMVLATEGGYDLKALGACLEATLHVSANDEAEAELAAIDSGDTRLAQAALDGIRAVHRKYWRL